MRLNHVTLPAHDVGGSADFYVRLWREAILLDPDGHRIFVFHAGENRIDPPWRLRN